MYLESVASVCVVPVPGTDAALLPDERRHLLELLAVHVAVPVQVEHAEGDLEVPPRCYNDTNNNVSVL